MDQKSIVEYNNAGRDFFLQIEKLKVFPIQKNECSRLHHLHHAMKVGGLIGSEDKSLPYAAPMFEHSQSIVVKHDWAVALAGSIDKQDDFILPYPHCCFELKIGGFVFLKFITQIDHKTAGEITFVAHKGHWFLIPKPDIGTDPTRLTDLNLRIIFILIDEQIRAICIALDAEVATKTVIRAPFALNKKREKSGKLPIRDYHVVDLSKRSRVAAPGLLTGGTKVRLHFRRGHWRHFETSKTWIRWALVGDPDLGFIDKHYIA